MKKVLHYSMLPLAILGVVLIWNARTSKSIEVRELPSEFLQRAEKAFACRFPTNYQVLNHATWIRSLSPRGDWRIGAVRIVTDSEGWETLSESLNAVLSPANQPELENSFHEFADKAPWMACVKRDWHRIQRKTVNRDPDGWSREHWLDVYVKAQDANWEVVIVTTDTRSEVNN